MSRGKAAPKRVTLPDPKYKSELVSTFINFVMKDGKKTTAQSIVYGAFDMLKEKKKDDPLQIFERALNNIKPQMEVKSRRVGGANYQVPMPVVGRRQTALAFRWLVTAAKARPGKSMTDRLANELIDALDGTGGAIKKREDVHRQAEANKAFAHFARFVR